MDFNIHTKISDIIRYNKSSIDAIASIAPPLKRLKNPILRKVMASRVTVAEAAKMGGCKVEDFERVLKPLGYRFSGNEQQAAPAAVPPNAEGKEKPDWLKAAPGEDLIRFDVRPVIERGTDPLKEIMRKFNEVPGGKILCIINTFVPTPLIHLLEKDKAESSFVDTISDKEFHTYFLKKQKKNSATSGPSEKVVMHDAASFEKVSTLFLGENRTTIDVRDLEMPLPMQTILAELETLPAGHGLYVHHKRVPVFLLEELAAKDFSVHIHNIDEGDVKMLIFKDQ
ncbi:DUF2249 domain-containing protein [Niabella aquatica]